jgi:hypothetical protein
MLVRSLSLALIGALHKVTKNTEMKFSTVREYFQKLHNILYGILLAPVLLFGYTYLQAGYGVRPMPAPDARDFLSYLIVFLFLATVTVAAGVYSRRIKAMTGVGIPGLFDRLGAYARATILRFSLTAAACFMLIAGLLLTGNPVHVGLFVFSLILFSFWWPSPHRVCKELRLKNGEREAVMSRGEGGSEHNTKTEGVE